MFDPAAMLVWMLVLVRTTALMLSMPILSHTAFPRRARIGLAAVLAWIILPAAVPLEYPAHGFVIVLLVAKEVAIGVLMGIAVRMVFAVVDYASQVIAVEIGLHPAPQFDSTANVSGNPIGTGLFYLGVVVFFSGAHYAVILALARSLELVPPGLQRPDLDFVAVFVRQAAHIVELGVLVAAPFMAVNFLINLTFSLLGRVVPRLNVFVLSFSARILAGLSLLALSAGLFAHYLIQEFRALPEIMLRLLPFAAR